MPDGISRPECYCGKLFWLFNVHKSVCEWDSLPTEEESNRAVAFLLRIRDALTKITK